MGYQVNTGTAGPVGASGTYPESSAGGGGTVGGSAASFAYKPTGDPIRRAEGLWQLRRRRRRRRLRHEFGRSAHQSRRRRRA